MTDVTKLLAAAHQNLKRSVGRFSFQGQEYVAKRLQTKPPLPGQNLLISWFSKRIAQQSPITPTSPVGHDYELVRLQSLAAAGIRVPPVLAHDQELMVLADCGTDGFNTMKTMGESERKDFLARLAEDLAQFHKMGQWHGGAQIKNVLIDGNGTIYRIDFEEYFAEKLPLCLAQAYDLVLFLNSIPLAGPIGDGEARQLLPQILQTYFVHYPSTEVRTCLVRLLPYARFICIAARPFKWLSRKSIRRIEILTASLKTFLTSTPHA